MIGATQEARELLAMVEALTERVAKLESLQPLVVINPGPIQNMEDGPAGDSQAPAAKSKKVKEAADGVSVNPA